jgi:SOS-response transcriptional repressor LexA
LDEIHNEKLTYKEKQILQAIIDYIDNNTISPTVLEIGFISKLKSTSTVQRHLERLRDKGYIENKNSMPRTIRVLKYIK